MSFKSTENGSCKLHNIKRLPTYTHTYYNTIDSHIDGCHVRIVHTETES